jgi:hypothetical protein
MSPADPALDDQALTARYETLRQDVVAAGSCRHTVRGLALFMRYGMAAWMKNLGDDPVCRVAVSAASPALRIPEGIERKLVDIVASMALATALENVR